MYPAPQFDPELIRRYDRRGPRYTSYPTAVEFSTRFDALAYRRAALLSNASRMKPLSAYVHVPFCRSPCFYCGCNRIITRDAGKAVSYLKRLVREIELQGALFDRSRTVQQLHLGGGTPTFLSIAQLEEVIDQLARSFRLDGSERREFSIEVDPRTVERATFAGLATLGFNRTSLGVQDFDERVQQAINRRQSIEQVASALLQARAAGFRSVSFDLIYGLPLQTPQSFARTLDLAIGMRPDRLAVYGYAHMPAMFTAQRALRPADLPDADARLQLLTLSIERLTAAGYVHIGMDHFALPEDELTQALHTGNLHRNFQGYSTRAECDLIGLGVSAISSIDNVYAQNFKRLPAYYDALDHGRLPVERGISLTVDDRARRDIIQSVMCTGRIDCREIEQRYTLDFAKYFAPALQQLRPMMADGLLERIDETIEVSDRGRFLLRSIAMAFDAHLYAASAPVLSKVI